MLIKYNGLRTTKHCMVNLALLQSHYTATANRQSPFAPDEERTGCRTKGRRAVSVSDMAVRKRRNDEYAAGAREEIATRVTPAHIAQAQKFARAQRSTTQPSK